MKMKWDKTQEFEPVVYSREEAFKYLNGLTKFFYYIGAINMSLKQSEWTIHYRWWHPVTWLTILFMGIGGFITWAADFCEEYCTKVNKNALLNNAPKKILPFMDFCVEPLDEENNKDADANKCFFAKRVLTEEIDICLGDCVEYTETEINNAARAEAGYSEYPDTRNWKGYTGYKEPVIMYVEHIQINRVDIVRNQMPMIDWRCDIISADGKNITLKQIIKVSPSYCIHE